MKAIVCVALIVLVGSNEISRFREWHCGDEDLYAISTDIMRQSNSIVEVYERVQDALRLYRRGQWNIFASQYARSEASFIQILGGGWGHAANARLQNPNLCMILYSGKAWVLMVAKTDDSKWNKAKLEE
ncbi:unnamed protein product [Bursaphelenchus xylophilus]|uniref:(pine wood nematode) hypothetical protein n=1 Tax=Bursaphelenchus xylophilus TaxID=6326 RepID=A0A7I8WY24_BURXY|nr:unnamed protein product [Bursaphelenchus xylophilus]CAG9100993.1 unnamed protein product [Bursaphelenchus xylophilus]